MPAPLPQRLLLLLLLLLLLMFAGTATASTFEDIPNYMEEFPIKFPRRPRRCEFPCQHGACSFTSCINPECPGGACYFKDCVNASCSGGACVFEASRKSTCGGGGCHFLNPADTLGEGYCSGHGCFLHGRAHPNFADYILI